MNDLIILKIGGSILTLKEKNKPIFRTRFVDRIIKEIKKFQEKNQSPLIIVLGTGSFGHPVANEYKLAQGLINKNSIMGFAKSKRSGYLVSNYFWDLMEKNKLFTVPIQPSAVITSTNGKISKLETRTLLGMLRMGLIVLTIGDEVLDTDKGFSICSSDQIASCLAKKLNANKLLFATDVDGVYESNPKINKHAKRLGVVNETNFTQVLASFRVHNKFDVSNEMAGKLKAINDFKNKNTKVNIFNGLEKGNVLRALNGEEIGTLVKF